MCLRSVRRSACRRSCSSGRHRERRPVQQTVGRLSKGGSIARRDRAHSWACTAYKQWHVTRYMRTADALAAQYSPYLARLQTAAAGTSRRARRAKDRARARAAEPNACGGGGGVCEGLDDEGVFQVNFFGYGEDESGGLGDGDGGDGVVGRCVGDRGVDGTDERGGEGGVGRRREVVGTHLDGHLNREGEWRDSGRRCRGRWGVALPWGRRQGRRRRRGRRGWRGGRQRRQWWYGWRWWRRNGRR